ncbi:unnamed protein product [Schistocephalus solidus]|uniref:Uncharacterized protein n=1 Tax=Schistocephalus solidus TaxID=70667 RepID=A0A183SRT3_SCHSO|nr:unnamed protein product [Schistocephalus solidus]
MDTLCDRTISHTLGAVADAAAGRDLVWQPTSSNPICDSSVHNTLFSQLASHFYGTGPEVDQPLHQCQHPDLLLNTCLLTSTPSGISSLNLTNIDTALPSTCNLATQPPAFSSHPLNLAPSCQLQPPMLPITLLVVPTHASTTTVHDLLFADDCAINTMKEEVVQMSMYLFAAGCVNFILNINTDTTLDTHQLPSSAEYNAPRINLNDTQLKTVDNLADLGSTLSHNTRIEDEVAQQISEASQAFGRLQASVCNHHGLQLNTNL